MAQFVSKLVIDKFRKFKNITVELGEYLTVIAGQNGTQKTTLMGMIGQPFSMKDETLDEILDEDIKVVRTDFLKSQTIEGKSFKSEISDRIIFSNSEIDFEKITSEKRAEEKDKDLKKTMYGFMWDVYFGNEELYNAKKNENGDMIYPMLSFYRTNGIRFWTKSRRKGDGYKTLPVIYLSLNRLLPLSDVQKDIEVKEEELNDDEKNFFMKHYPQILCLHEKLESLETITNTSGIKNTLVATSEHYDSTGASAGQDNTGQIIRAVLSFKRLKHKFPNDYIGGMLLIDEADATLYPYAQEKLFSFLYSQAKELNLQIVLTSHSMELIELTFDKRFHKKSKLVYLGEKQEGVKVQLNLTAESVRNHLSYRTKQNIKLKVPKINFLAEDSVGISIARHLIPPNWKQCFSFFDKLTLGAESYCTLIKNKFPHINESIVLLDGDKKTKKYQNVVILPPNSGKKGDYPEKLLFEYLKSLDDKYPFWENGELDGYTFQVCFKDHTQTFEKSFNNYKNWYKEQLKGGARWLQKVIKYWKKDNQKEYARFLRDLKNAYQYCIENNRYVPTSAFHSIDTLVIPKNLMKMLEQ